MKARKKRITTPSVEELEALYALPGSPQPTSPEPTPQSEPADLPDPDKIEVQDMMMMTALDILIERAEQGDELVCQLLEELTASLDEACEIIRSTSDEEAALCKVRASNQRLEQWMHDQEFE